jgi:hypothetical protein
MSHSYIFVRKDLSLEQQIVQAAHALHLVGLKQEDRRDSPSIVLIGVEDLWELQEVSAFLNANRIEYEMFYESYLQECTAIATHPLEQERRHLLSGFKTLKYGSKTEA